jgi:hypothetical protein
MLRAFALASLVIASTSFAEDLTPEKAAVVTRARQKALDEVAKKYGNRKANELTSDERRARMADEAAAVQRVLDANGIDARELARFEATANRGDQNALKAAEKALDEKEAAAKKSAEAQKPVDGADEHGVVIERGNGASGSKKKK